MASSGPGYGGEVGNQIFGGIMLIASLLWGSLNLALAGRLGDMWLNVCTLSRPSHRYLRAEACSRSVATGCGKKVMSYGEIGKHSFVEGSSRSSGRRSIRSIISSTNQFDIKLVDRQGISHQLVGLH